MTHFQAIQSVEDALTNLGLKDLWGEPVTGIECIGAVAKFYGVSWDELLDRFETGQVTPEQYATKAKEMIEAYSRYRFRDKLEKKFIKLNQEKTGS